jgi:hypothetical protein
MCNPDNPVPADPEVDPKLAARIFRMLGLLVDTVGMLVEAKRTIARLEAGERRFKCCSCRSVVWSTSNTPPPSWLVVFDGPTYYCQDCAAALHQGDQHA